MKYEKIILKSTHPEEYPDLEIVCKVISNDQIGNYLETISDEEKFYAYKNKPVSVRLGIEGEKIRTVLKTIVAGKEYVLSEEDAIVKNRDGRVDIVVTNDNSTSNEQYVVKASKFDNSYEFISEDISDKSQLIFMPVHDSRSFTRVSENVIIMTAWGAPAVCLAGSYIVTYNAEENDYNVVEQDAFSSTYTKEEQKVKKLKR